MSDETREVLAAEVLPKEAAFCIQQAGVEPESAMQLKAAFLTMFRDADQWLAKARAIVVTDASQLQEMKQAKEMRLKLRAIRCDAENARKRLKEDSLRRGKAIDGIANVLKALIEPVEAYLGEQETFAERAEAKRKAEVVTARTAQIAPYAAVFGNAANGMDLSVMSDEQFNIFHFGLKHQHDAKVAAEAEAARLREENEKRDRESRERMAAELERLRAEQAAKDAENAKLRAEAEARAAEDLAKAAAALEIERKRAEQEASMLRAQAEAERAERERLVAEIALRERTEAEKADVARRVALLSAQAPDREKLLAFGAVVRALVVPDLASDAGRAFVTVLREQVEKFAGWVEQKARTGF